MSIRIHYHNCPVCGFSDFKTVFEVQDYTVSGERFSISECGNCSLRFTQDVPDAASIAPYYKSEDYISHTDESKGLIGKLYKKVRKKTLSQKRKLLIKETGLSTGNLLDIGCGTGAFANEMVQHKWQVRGLEPDAGARAMAKQLYNLDLEDEKNLFQLSPEYFDAITLWHVLEHVHDLMGYIRQIKLILKAKGKLLIAVPNYTSLDAKIYKEYWAAYDVPRHLYHFSPKAMEQFTEKNGLKIVGYKAMWYDSFYISLLSSKYKNGKSRWMPSLWNGLRSDFRVMGNIRKCSSLVYIISKQ